MPSISKLPSPLDTTLPFDVAPSPQLIDALRGGPRGGIAALERRRGRIVARERCHATGIDRPRG